MSHSAFELASLLSLFVIEMMINIQKRELEEVALADLR